MTNIEFIADRMVHEEWTPHALNAAFLIECAGAGLFVFFVLAWLLVQTFLAASVH